MMKKCILLGGVALIILALAGCNDEIKDAIIGEKPDLPVMTLGFTKGLTDFEVQTGDQAGEIKYKFTATDPEATSYTLYYGTAGINKGDLIIDQNKTMPVTPQNDFTALSGFVQGRSYSVVVVAKKGDDYARSAVIPSVQAKSDQLELIVDKIPNAAKGKIWGASLMAPSAPTIPVAIGMQDNSKAFIFYYPMVSGRYPDFNKPFKETGAYMLAIASADLITQQEEEIYMYNGSTITYSTTNTSITVDWDDFTVMGGGPIEPVATNTVITINNKPSNVNILAVMSNNNTVQIAIGMNLGGNTFTLYEPGSLGPDITKPWKGSGDYSILLLNMATPVATYTNTPYSFTGQAAITFNYTTDFTPISSP